MTTVATPAIEGYVAPGFEPVRDAFEANFAHRGELGGACCAYLRGEKVVDIWGGVRNKTTGAPWERDTMVVIHSATKGLAAMTLAIAHSRGWLDYDERVATYWPEFAQNGKQDITVRQLLAHQAGLFAFDEPVDRNTVADLNQLAAVMARQKPAWPPGTRQAYHGLTLGFYEGELLRRVDPWHRSLGRFLRDEIATPLGEDLYIGLPDDIPNARLAMLSSPGRMDMIFGFRPVRLMLEGLNPQSNINRALSMNPGTSVYLDEKRVYARNLEVPAGGGVATARGIAHAYSAFVTGFELGLRGQTLDLLAAPALPPTHGFFDECLKVEVQFSLGFSKPSDTWRFSRSTRAFGCPGAGGAMGFADPDVGLGYAYVTSQMGTTLSGDPRDLALSAAVYRAAGVE